MPQPPPELEPGPSTEVTGDLEDPDSDSLYDSESSNEDVSEVASTVSKTTVADPSCDSTTIHQDKGKALIVVIFSVFYLI